MTGNIFDSAIATGVTFVVGVLLLVIIVVLWEAYVKDPTLVLFGIGFFVGIPLIIFLFYYFIWGFTF